MKKIAVIGAGIAGTTTAYALLKKGHSVTIIDSRRYPAMATSYANGGQLSASNAETWNTTKNVISGIKWMFTPDAPLLFNPLADEEGIEFELLKKGILRFYDNAKEFKCELRLSKETISQKYLIMGVITCCTFLWCVFFELCEILLQSEHISTDNKKNFTR